MAFRARIFIDLEPNATPIAGYIATDHGDRRPFHGWLELSAAIEQRRTSTTHPRRLGGEWSRGGHPRGVAGWLTSRTQPRWMLMGAWACAVWSAAAVPMLAATSQTEVLAWWAFGLVAALVVLTFVWTEQRPTAGPEDQGAPASQRITPAHTEPSASPVSSRKFTIVSSQGAAMSPSPVTDPSLRPGTAGAWELRGSHRA